MLPNDFYQHHLDQVSRSFAFCIARLDEPLRPWVGLTYLLCRLLDTVEDSAWTSWPEQKRHFHEFDRFLAGDFSAVDVREWSRRFPYGIPPSEKALADQAFQLFDELHGPSLEVVRPIIQELGRSMSAGMQLFMNQRQSGELKLENLEQVNQYCFFVAGVVGEALAKLLATVEPEFQLNAERILEAHHFGLFLQKVNILKDQLEDEKLGRHLVPNRDLILKSAANNAEGAFRFIAAVPLHQKNFRLFCAWSFFLGLGTLVVVEDAYKKKSSGKLSRALAEKLIRQIEEEIDNPQALERLFLRAGKELSLDVKNWRQTRLQDVEIQAC